LQFRRLLAIELAGAELQPGKKMFGPESSTLSALESVAHTIQVALTPVFLLSAVAALLNVFSTRLGRVADRVDLLTQALAGADAKQAAHLAVQLAYLRTRSLWLDAAVVLGTLAGAFTCVATLTLFVGALRETTGVSILFAAFGIAIACTTGALAAFLAETLLAGRGLRAEVAVRRTQAHNGLTGTGAGR
jgi:hypothetical protein